MTKRIFASPLSYLVGGVLLGALIVVGALKLTERSAPTSLGLQEQVIRAVGSSTQTDFCLATGAVDGGVEGVFALDGVTGQLTLWVLNPKTGGAAGIFKHSVLGDLAVVGGKAPRLTMATGTTSAVRAGGGAKFADTVVYVGDANTGNVVGYMFAWDRNRAAAGAPQLGGFVRVAAFKGRDAAIENN